MTDLDAARREAEKALAKLIDGLSVMADRVHRRVLSMESIDYGLMTALRELRNLSSDLSAPAPAPPSDAATEAVREAAERLRQAMVIGESYSCSNEECIDCRAHDLLVALDAPAPEPDGKEKGVGK